MRSPSFWEEPPEDELDLGPDDWEWGLSGILWTDEMYQDMLSDYERRVNEGRYD